MASHDSSGSETTISDWSNETSTAISHHGNNDNHVLVVVLLPVTAIVCVAVAIGLVSRSKLPYFLA